MADYRWIEIAPGRKRLVDISKPLPSAPARSSIGFPTIMSGGFDEPVQSMADGQWYSDKAALERSYRAENNPQGVEYACVGDKPIEPYTRPTPTREDEEAKDAAIARALDEAGY